jgi:hypothetical protein
MLDPKWTGTDRDRSEMRTLKLQQVVRVSAQKPIPLSLLADPANYCCSVISANMQCLASPQTCLPPGNLLLCMSCSLLNNETLSPFFSSTLGVSLANGGTAGLFWNYVVGAIGLSFVYASIAELGSM